ncbi:hypothetical protein [Roseimicrobium sp. ORNL1]|uniref:hypothetical protein n=1 Tax=Roseimicrobium sp. ORNL1 TaxID=2711231 RepID=UPI0013E1C13B|nr:hypothetical protein [Roseimicrobium sp. ORNL1]QIF01423.1 hypothetical protein G5S37_07780 [Roseimicrobium sp. ORNL1]
MRWLAITWMVLQSLAACYGDILPELQSASGYDSVAVEGWTTLSDDKRHHLKLNTESREVVDRITNYLKGLDCVPITLDEGAASSDVVKITLKSKDKTVVLALFAKKYVIITESRAFYEIRNVSESAGALLMHKLVADYPHLIRDIPPSGPPP